MGNATDAYAPSKPIPDATLSRKVSEPHGERVPCQWGQKSDCPPPPPVVGLAMYAHDACVVRAASGRRYTPRDAERGAAAPWSEESARHLRHVVANGPAAWTAVLLVTLPAGRYADGEGVRAALARLLDRVRKKWGRGHYLWVREWTEEGTPHYHILLTVPSTPTHRSRRKSGRWAKIDGPKQDWLRRAWRAAASRIATWGEGVESICSWECVDDPIAAARYIGFYSAKKSQKTPPVWAENYGRWWAASQGMEPQVREYLPATEAEIIAALGPGYTDCRSGLYRTLHGAAALLREREEEILFVGSETGRKYVPAPRVAHFVRQSEQLFPRIDPPGEGSTLPVWEWHWDRMAARRVARAWLLTPPLSRCTEWTHDDVGAEGAMPLAPAAAVRRPHPAEWLARWGLRISMRDVPVDDYLPARTTPPRAGHAREGQAVPE